MAIEHSFPYIIIVIYFLYHLFDNVLQPSRFWLLHIIKLGLSKLIYMEKNVLSSYYTQNWQTILEVWPFWVQKDYVISTHVMHEQDHYVHVF